jgi:hypothetical protein
MPRPSGVKHEYRSCIGKAAASRSWLSCPMRRVTGIGYAAITAESRIGLNNTNAGRRPKRGSKMLFNGCYSASDVCTSSSRTEHTRSVLRHVGMPPELNASARAWVQTMVQVIRRGSGTLSPTRLLSAGMNGSLHVGSWSARKDMPNSAAQTDARAGVVLCKCPPARAAGCGRYAARSGGVE